MVDKCFDFIVSATGYQTMIQVMLKEFQKDKDCGHRSVESPPAFQNSILKQF